MSLIDSWPLCPRLAAKDAPISRGRDEACMHKVACQYHIPLVMCNDYGVICLNRFEGVVEGVNRIALGSILLWRRKGVQNQIVMLSIILRHVFDLRSNVPS